MSLTGQADKTPNMNKQNRFEDLVSNTCPKKTVLNWAAVPTTVILVN
jgi:hypothetical protein